MVRGKCVINDGAAPRPRTSVPREPKNRRYYLDLNTPKFGSAWVKDPGIDAKFLGEVKLDKEWPDPEGASSAVVGALGSIARIHELER